MGGSRTRKRHDVTDGCKRIALAAMLAQTVRGLGSRGAAGARVRRLYHHPGEAGSRLNQPGSSRVLNTWV